MIRQRKSIIPMSESDNEARDSVSIQAYSLKGRNSIHQLPTSLAFIVVIFLFLLYIGIFFASKSLPTPLRIEDEKSHPDAFIAQRAQRFLKSLTEHGPRVVGSEQNEKLAVELINNEIQNIKDNAHPSHKILVDNQITSGSYFLNFLPHGFINSYGNVQNIIVKIQGKSDADNLLINAHFDSVPTSPGASDDGIMVAIMLEVIRKLTQKEQHFERSLIFLFNGAEETQFHASHGFITQHKWASSCKLLINLEAAGHGGKAILFQTGPLGSPDFIKHYSKVSLPYAQAGGEEIFRSNLVPSDTDFRIFRDFGGLSGFDIAFAGNGYRYHTHFDSFEDLPLGSYQHAGDILLSTVQSIANTIGLDNTSDRVVYFDVFNLFMISYSTTVAITINLIVVACSIAIAIVSMRSLHIGFTWDNIFYVSVLTVAILVSWLFSGAFVILIAFILDWANKTMTWYRFPGIITPLYVAPILAFCLYSLNLFHRFGSHGSKNINAQSQIQMHIIRLIWTSVLFVGTVMSIRSVYFIMIPVLLNSIACAIIWILKWQQSVRKWTICAFTSSVGGAVFIIYNSIGIYSLFIPITGRIGRNINPELIISLLTLVIVLVAFTYFFPKSVLIKQPHMVPTTLIALFSITLLIILTGAIWPYSGNKGTPTPQRIMLYHTNRIHHQPNDNVIEKSGIFLLNLDRNSPKSIQDIINFETEDISSDCSEYPSCGMPISSARMIPIVQFSTWIKFEKAIIKEGTSMNYSTEILTSTRKRYHFIVNGPDHLTVLLRPRKGATIVRTSVHNGTIGDTLYINHVYGLVKTPLTFTIDVSSTSPKDPALDIAVSGKFYNIDKEEMTPSFRNFIAKIPDWADVTPVVANYESFII